MTTTMFSDTGELPARRRKAREPKHGLTFSEGNHRYWLDGKPVPGVTTIIGVLDKPAIPKWAAEQVAKYVAENPAGVDALRPLGVDGMTSALKQVPWKKRDDAADRGTAFHWYAQEILLGRSVDVPGEQVPLVEAALEFMDDWEIEPVAVEQQVGSREHRYAGTVDLVADCRRDQRAIFDWKSGRRIYASAVFQLSAYANAEFYGLDGDEHPVADWGIQAAYGVHIQPEGYSVYPLQFGADVFQEFLTIRAAYELNKRAEGNWKIAGSGYVGVPLELER